ncbi:hypothetical protein [Brevundimonas bacteroides]|uniref:hypothetical protein n=1 Tax=Brevundimonas bacteroides TaxID=74311 RepID=UPI00068A256F|nr:hypothetical protein [Brevundimonas bacteroides]
MTRNSISESVAARLHSAEAAIDAALAEAAQLAALLPSARAEAYLSAVTGQKAFDGAAASIAALTEARSRMVDTHNTLAALARKMGLDTAAVGILDKPEDEPPHGGGVKAFAPPEVNKVLAGSL